jgi:2-phospho-L-lactate guanylyltransferase
VSINPFIKKCPVASLGISNVLPKDVWAIVPAKPLAKAKSRLATILNPAQRKSLVIAMLGHVLDVLTQVDLLAQILVVSADPEIGALTVAHHTTYYPEIDTPGLNLSLLRTRRYAQAQGAQRILILPADLPLMKPESIVSLLRQVEDTPSIVIVPDYRGCGTNALLLAPPDVIPFDFGDGSFQRHLTWAKSRGVSPVIFHAPDLERDIDVPEDLSLVRQWL